MSSLLRNDTVLTICRNPYNFCSIISDNLALISMGLLLYLTHVTRRLYECLYVSIFSDSNMNLLHFLLGCTFYPLCVCSQLSSFTLKKKAGKPFHNFKIFNNLKTCVFFVTLIPCRGKYFVCIGFCGINFHHIGDTTATTSLLCSSCSTPPT